MAKVKFIGVPGEKHDELKMFGVTLPLGKFVPVTDQYAISVFKDHPHFEFQAEGNDATDVDFKEVAKEPKEAKGPYDDVLSMSVADISPLIETFSDAELQGLKEAEEAGKARVGLIGAIDKEIEARKPQE